MTAQLYQESIQTALLQHTWMGSAGSQELSFQSFTVFIGATPLFVHGCLRYPVGTKNISRCGSCSGLHCWTLYKQVQFDFLNDIQFAKLTSAELKFCWQAGFYTIYIVIFFPEPYSCKNIIKRENIFMINYAYTFLFEASVILSVCSLYAAVTL